MLRASIFCCLILISFSSCMSFRLRPRRQTYPDSTRYCSHGGKIIRITDKYCYFGDRCAVVCSKMELAEYKTIQSRNQCQDIVDAKSVPRGCRLNKHCIIVCPVTGNYQKIFKVKKKTFSSCKYKGSPIPGCRFDRECKLVCNGKGQSPKTYQVKTNVLRTCKYKGLELRPGCTITKECRIECSEKEEEEALLVESTEPVSE